jgi:hypothetical protein
VYFRTLRSAKQHEECTASSAQGKTHLQRHASYLATLTDSRTNCMAAAAEARKHTEQLTGTDCCCMLRVEFAVIYWISGDGISIIWKDD